MREIIARLVCVLTFVVIAAVSLQFSIVHNPRVPLVPPERATPPSPTSAATPAATVALPPPTTEPPQSQPLPLSSDAQVERGRAVYAQQNCSGCHAIAGAGNPRYPLDGVGQRRVPAELAAWVTGTGVAADELSAAVIRRKQRFRELPPEDLQALVAYVATLKDATASTR